MKNTHEDSDAEYYRLIENPIPGPLVPFKPLRREVYSTNGKHTVAIVRSNDRRAGMREAYRLMGGLGKLTDGVSGEIVIKPNCNTDDAFPRNSHHETVRVIAEGLIETGFPAEKICAGDTSGRYRGLPTRNTIEEMGIKAVADDLGIQVGYFEEEEYERSWKTRQGEKFPEPISFFHRTLSTYLNSLSSAGFRLIEFAEPLPIDNDQFFNRERRIPFFAVFKAQKI